MHTVSGCAPGDRSRPADGARSGYPSVEATHRPRPVIAKCSSETVQSAHEPGNQRRGKPGARRRARQNAGVSPSALQRGCRADHRTDEESARPFRGRGIGIRLRHPPADRRGARMAQSARVGQKPRTHRTSSAPVTPQTQHDSVGRRSARTVRRSDPRTRPGSSTQ